ncbi:GNAT family N-acetyltransferase [Desulfohalovibrio reitneri]|uniref:GNAT family N-acetyltransferase n=1 Tax=Desulfohalovibrio reitneri TaxID=1307759 RepID=UPI0013787E7B|nr:GNAT family N-acetyltransferase [Desulfohalovibrio reitneri]
MTSPSGLRECIDLQREIWGLDEAGATSPITLGALAMEPSPAGLVLSAYRDGRMVGMAVVLATMDERTAYGHMLGVLPGERNTGLGSELKRVVFEVLRRKGMRRFRWTFEPMESRNAHLYVNRFGARCLAYKVDCFQVESGMHQGLPLDRLLAECGLDARPERKPRPPRSGLKGAPVAAPGRMPFAEAVLLPIPSDLNSLKERDMGAAMAFRLATREVLLEYLNRRGYAVSAFFPPDPPESDRAHYLLTRESPS